MLTEPKPAIFSSLTVQGVFVSESEIRPIPMKLPVTVFRSLQMEALLSGPAALRVNVAKRLCQRWRKAGYVTPGPKGVWFWAPGAREQLVSQMDALQLEGTQYDVYVDTHALSEHARVDLATGQQTFEYASAVSQKLIEAAARKRSSVQPDTVIVIDDPSEIPI